MLERVITGMLGTLCSFRKQQSVFPNPENGFKPNMVGILPPNKMSDIQTKPKRVLTEEQKAKMKAGREAKKAERDAAKESGTETPKPTSDSEAASTTSSKTKRTLTDEQKAKMKAGREAAKAKREADKAAGIEPPKKEPKAKKSAVTQKMWEAVLNEVKKDLQPEFEAYIKTKLE